MHWRARLLYGPLGLTRKVWRRAAAGAGWCGRRGGSAAADEVAAAAPAACASSSADPGWHGAGETTWRVVMPTALSVQTLAQPLKRLHASHVAALRLRISVVSSSASFGGVNQGCHGA